MKHKVNKLLQGLDDVSIPERVLEALKHRFIWDKLHSFQTVSIDDTIRRDRPYGQTLNIVNYIQSLNLLSKPIVALVASYGKWLGERKSIRLSS